MNHIPIVFIEDMKNERSIVMKFLGTYLDKHLLKKTHIENAALKD